MIMKFRLNRLMGMLSAAAMACTCLAGLPGISESKSVSAAPSSYRFDFGAGGTENGYIGVDASTSYSAQRGYGFRTPGNMKNVTASGSGALSDAVQFVTSGVSTDNTFDVDLDNGLYQVTVTLGNTNRTSVAAEGVYQLMNLTGNNATDTFQIPITDGQLNINCTAGKDGYPYTLSALEITKLSSDPTMKPTIWLCGDSTVCNYYPLATSTQAGWGQIFPRFIDTNVYQVRNMATGGQYAEAFMNYGQFDAILKYIKPGDYYFISIGINDTNYSNQEAYYNALTSMTKQAKAKGATVILVAQQGRQGDISNSALNADSGRWFNGTVKQVASEQNVQCIDLFKLFYNHCKSVGQTVTDTLYIDSDTLHPNRAGATVLAELVAKSVSFSTISELPGTELPANTTYQIQNVNSGLYLEVQEGKAENGANVQQWGANGVQQHNLWKVIPSGQNDGYYYIYSMLGDGNTFLLDVDYGKTQDGTNIGIYQNTHSDAQLYKFIDCGDGTFRIGTKVTNGHSILMPADNSTANGGNVIESTYTGLASQRWKLEAASLPVVTEPVKALIKGDLNDDGILNGVDIVLFRQAMNSGFGTKAMELAADVNYDGSATVADLVLLQKYAARMIREIPAAQIARYDAIKADFTQGITETINAGYTADAYLNLNNELGSSVTFRVSVPKAGNYLVTFRVANGSANNRPMMLSVIGGTDRWRQDFLTTGAWTAWQDRGIVLPLQAGINSITAVSDTAEGGPNMDYITLEQTDEPIAETYVKPAETQPAGSNPTIYIAGDSTVQTYRASYAPQQGWGAYLADYLDSSVSVSNRAIAGRSSKSFYDNGRLDTILGEIKAGDYLMVQFGINDSAASNAERYAPVCGSATNPTDGSFEFYIEKYVEGALDKGATPILVTTVIGLKAYSGGKFVNSYGNYCQAMKDIAAKYNIPCIDLNSLMVAHYNTIGYDTAYTYHLISAVEGSTDMTHFTETGAKAVANLVAQAVKNQNITPLAEHVK